MINTPKNPSATALQRRARTFSPSITMAARVTKMGDEYVSEIASASGKWAIAQNPQNILTMPIAVRSK